MITLLAIIVTTMKYLGFTILNQSRGFLASLTMCERNLMIVLKHFLIKIPVEQMFENRREV